MKTYQHIYWVCCPLLSCFVLCLCCPLLSCFVLCLCCTAEDKLPGILRENQLAGDEDARLLTREQLREEAPELSSEARGGVFCPHEGEYSRSEQNQAMSKYEEVGSLVVLMLCNGWGEYIVLISRAYFIAGSWMFTCCGCSGG